MQKIKTDIVQKTVDGLREEGRTYVGMFTIKIQQIRTPKN